MDYYQKYIKYKTKYLALKHQLIGGNKKKPLSSWQKKFIDRKKELENTKNTKSFIPFEKLSKKDKVYFIQDNGAIPFKVVANNEGIIVYTSKQKSNYDTEIIHDKNIMKIKNFIGYWYGFDSSPYKINGNSILIQINQHNYIHIGREIYKFKTDDIINDYVSPMGNNDVPYPVAFGEKNVYFFLDRKFVKANDFETSITVANAEDLYREFYGLKKGKYDKFDMINLKILYEHIK